MKSKSKSKSEKTLYRAMGIVFVMIISICIFYTVTTGREIQENNHEYLVNDTERLAGNIGLILQQGSDNVLMLSKLVSESLTSEDVDISKYREIINDSVFDFVEFADVNGMNHNVTGGISDAADRKYYLDAMQGNSGVEIIFNSRATHENLLMFYTPVYYNGKIAGSLIGVYQASNKITELITTEYFGNESKAYLCTKDGRIFAESGRVEKNDVNADDKSADVKSAGAKSDAAAYITDVIDAGKETNNTILEKISKGEEYSFSFDGSKSSGYLMQVPDNEWVLVKIYPSEANARMINRFVKTAIYMVAAISVIFFLQQYIIFRVNKSQNMVITEQLETLSAMADIYYSMHLIDLKDYSVKEYEANDLIKNIVDNGTNAIDIMQTVMQNTMTDEYLETGLEFTDVTTLAERMGTKNNIALDLLGRNAGWIRLSFIKIDEDEQGKPLHVIVTTQIINEQKEREKELLFNSQNDELTGLYNRRAYEDDLLHYPSVPVEPDFIYAAIDINGLKAVNDGLGHAAGDELIKGAAVCLKRTFGNYGKVYRTGGDEFTAMFFADEDHLKTIISDLENLTMEWKGELVSEVSLSVGYASKREFCTETVSEISEIADKRMYKAKQEYYSRKGFDRRGQAAAHTALCKLYTKILKINLTDDTYKIINSDLNEQTRAKGFAESISEWLRSFGTSGQVHKDDLDEYLKCTDTVYMKEYFEQNKTSLHIFYRRIIGEEFKQVMMEIIPADDYSDENQSLFLYVKEIDK